MLIAAITGLATISVVAGLDAGVKRLSELNIWLAIAFLAFMVAVGPTLFALSLFTESLGHYIQILPEFSFWNETFGGTSWQAGWTIFYWGWWISWSPFVGMFVARTSKGRSVRELLLGVIFIPSVLCFFWFSVFGGSSMNLQLTGARDMATAVNDNLATALFEMLEEFPLTGLVSFIGVLLISFFVTSSDSGSLVVDHLTSGGKLDSPKPQRVFWALMEGMVAIVLILGGGLGALPDRSGGQWAAVLGDPADHVLEPQEGLQRGARPAREPLRRTDLPRPAQRPDRPSEGTAHRRAEEVTGRLENPGGSK